MSEIINPCQNCKMTLMEKSTCCGCPERLTWEKQNKKGVPAMAKYRKKPVIIEAYQTDKELDIDTLEGVMHASVGDYIITGVHGEHYPCKPDIFEETYEKVEE